MTQVSTKAILCSKSLNPTIPRIDTIQLTIPSRILPKVLSIRAFSRWIDSEFEDEYKLLVTTTNWKSFESLTRLSHDNELTQLNESIQETLSQAPVQAIGFQDWHLPYIDMERDTKALCDYLANIQDDEPDTATLNNYLTYLSASRCTRFGHRLSSIKLELSSIFDREKTGAWTAFEHQASPDHHFSYMDRWKNFFGWVQYRSMVEIVSEVEEFN